MVAAKIGTFVPVARLQLLKFRQFLSLAPHNFSSGSVSHATR